MTQLAAHWPQLRLSPIPLITFLRPADMTLDKNVGEVVEPCDVKMLSYIKSDVLNLGQFENSVAGGKGRGSGNGEGRESKLFRSIDG